jgi:hypothetical protein
MCELVRALIAGGLIEGARLDDLNESMLEAIDCPGDGENGQSEICAVSGGSAAQKYSWYILLEGITFTTSQKPLWQLDPKSKELIDSRR